MNKTLLIIGNGFDLNLGLKTGYCDFIKSDYFKKGS
ncbi:MAG: AbiH family protein [Parabacteroides sp.]